jgi:acyl carrier protein
MKDKIIEEIVLFISDRQDIPLEKITPKSNFLKDLDMDSLEMMELVFEIEDRYNLSLTCTPSDVQTIEDLANILTKHIDNSKSIV